MIPTEPTNLSKTAMVINGLLILVTSLGLVICLAGCSPILAVGAVSTATPTPSNGPLVLYDWPGDIPPAVLEAFAKEYGIEVTLLTYESQEEAIENIRAGQVFDVVVVENQHIPVLAAEGLLAEIDLEHVPNFEHIASNFKNLAYDPGNRYSIPFNWGTTALVVRTDLTPAPVTRWADLWNPAYAGKVAMRALPRGNIGLTLKSLGYSINSEDPQELEAARERLLQLRPAVLFVDSFAEGVIPLLKNGEVVILVGWAEDVLAAQAENMDVSYVMPEEGALMWGDNFVIPVNSRQRDRAEQFLNFLLRPEISAEITNDNFYATPNYAARRFIKPEILNDPVIFPTNSDLKTAEVMLPLSPAGEARYAQIWEQFLAAP